MGTHNMDHDDECEREVDRIQRQRIELLQSGVAARRVLRDIAAQMRISVSKLDAICDQEIDGKSVFSGQPALPGPDFKIWHVEEGLAFGVASADSTPKDDGTPDEVAIRILTPNGWVPLDEVGE